jgi:starch synthase
MDYLLQNDLQLVILGTGEPGYHSYLNQLREERPNRVGVVLAYDDALAHLVEAGSDMFLMPSRFEPCGLNQLYSLKYGTVPVVRSTGGLADTVVDYTDEGLNSGRSTGFVFEDYTADALKGAVGRALTLYRDSERWRRLMLNGMGQDWSWDRSAEEYMGVYRRAVGKRTE